MKRALHLCLIGMAALNAFAATSNSTQPVQAFSAVIWTTTTLHSPAGKISTFMQRTVYTRDASGNVRREIYRPTKGSQQDTTAPLEHVFTGATSALTLSYVQSNKETIEDDVDLGTSQFFGLLARGRRQTFHDSNGQQTRMLETWYSATLALTVHTESRDARGDTVVSGLSELNMGSPVSPSAENASIVAPAIPLLNLYRGLFTLIAHMERDRQANHPNLHLNMNDIEDHLRKKIGLSAGEWQALVTKSVEVEAYTREATKRAHDFAEQNRAARQQNPLSANTFMLAVARGPLQKMQLDLKTHIQGEIDALKTIIGPGATSQIQNYLQGPLAASMSRTQLTPAQVQALRSHEGEGR